MACLSVARPVAIGFLTFFGLELLVACLLFTHTGQKLMPVRQPNALHRNAIQPSAARHVTHQLPLLQRS